MRNQNPSIRQAGEVVEALVRSGVRTFAYCPGSRNAPFAYVLSAYERAGRLSVATFAQESTATFWALGYAKAEEGKHPVAVLTTSGTAVTQMHSALEEARHQSLPIVALTSDRPFEMVGVGASQATDQNGIFGSTTVGELNVPAGTTTGISQRVARLIRRSLGWGGRGGPVHINVAFADPLIPSAPIDIAPAGRFPDFPQPVLNPVAPHWESVVDATLNTLVVAGDCEPGSLARVRAMGEYAARCLIPIIAEPSSGLSTADTWIPHGPLVCVPLTHSVQQVIVLGKPTLSRQVSSLLAQEGIRKIVVSGHDEWPDVSGNATVVVPALEMGAPVHHSQRWLEECLAVADEVSRILISAQQSAEVNHLGAAAEIWEASYEVDLWLGASNTVRSFDMAAGRPGRNSVFSNRGLAGIDGTISSAMGAQASSGRPMRVVMGDLTFLYDLPSLALPPTPGQDIQLIVFEDGGGTIFSSLEHGRVADPEVLQRFFAVEQQADICTVASGCGWETRTVSSFEQLRSALEVPVRGRSVVRVILDSPAALFDSVRNQVLALQKLRKH